MSCTSRWYLLNSLKSLQQAKLRVSGWVLIALGVGVPAALVPMSAWLARKDGESFDRHVDWANILAFSVGAVGVVLVALEKAGTLRRVPDAQFVAILRTLSEHVLRQNTHLLAQLLGTDSLDGRPAEVRFSLSGKEEKRRRSNPKVYSLHDVASFYESETRGRLVILGEAGTGKTVLAARLLVDLIKNTDGMKSGDEANSSPIPILLSLASWEPFDNGLDDWLKAQLAEQYRLSVHVAARLVSEGWIIPILDGLDEMDSSGDSPLRSSRAVDRINDYIALTPKSRIVLVSRTGNRFYRRLARRVRDADEVTVHRLDAEQVIEYIKDQCEDGQDVLRWQTVFTFIESPHGYMLLEILGTPWRLTTAVTFFLGGGDPDDLLPTESEISRSQPSGVDQNYSSRTLHALMITFMEAKARLYGGHRYDPARTVRSLLALSRFLSRMESNGDRSREIVLHNWWKAFGDKRVRIHHALVMFTVQHYPLGIGGFIGALLPPGAKWYTALAILVNYALIMQVATRYAVSRESPRSIRFNRLRTPVRAMMFAVSLIVCVLFGWLMAYATELPQGIAFGVAAAALLTIACTMSSEVEPYDETHPLRPLLNDRLYSTLVGVGLAAYTGIYYLPIYGVTIAVVFGSMSMLGGMLASAYARYIVAVVYAWSKFGLPLRFARFLEWGREAGLLRMSGVGYQFRHQELHEFLYMLRQQRQTS